MEQVVSRAGVWLLVLLLAFVAMAAAADGGFAIHMGIVCLTALIGLYFTVSTADYSALGRGFLKAPDDQSRYYDDVIRWGVIATVFWGMAGFLVGVVIALQLAFPALNLGLEWTSFGRLRPLHT